MRIIDLHCYPNTEPWIKCQGPYVEALAKYWNRTWTWKQEDEVVKEFADAGVEAVLVALDLETTVGTPPCSNDYVKAMQLRHPGRLIHSWAAVDPFKGEVARNDARHAITDLGMLGFHFHPIMGHFAVNDRQFYPLFEVINELKAPVMIDVGTTGMGAGMPGGLGARIRHAHPAALDDLAADFPDLKIIAAHPGWPWVDEMTAVALHKGNVYWEMSGWAPKYFPAQLKIDIRSRLQDKVMFGSDYPSIPYDRLLKEWGELGYADAVMEKIFHGNAERILGLWTSLLIVLAMPDEVIAAYHDPLRAHFPQIEINAVNRRDKIDPYIGCAEILLTFGAMMADEVFAKAQSLKWVQVLGTGVDRVANSPSLGVHVVITNIRGIHGAPVAEAALASMLALSRQLPRTIRSQDRHEWDRFPARLVDGKTVVMFGMGIIAEALGPRCKALGMRVIGVSSGPRAVPGFDRVLPREQLDEALGEADYFVLLTPHTPATHKIVGEATLRAMKPGGFFVSLGRGETVDEEALLAALVDGHLAGAALDVFTVEPLPPAHAFWTLKNVIVTPHLGGFYDEYPAQCLDVVEENLRRFLAGDRQNMINLVTRAKAPP